MQYFKIVKFEYNIRYERSIICTNMCFDSWRKKKFYYKLNDMMYALNERCV